MAVDQDLARKLLTDAAARYESACRWSLVVCISIFVFHILTFSPFIRAQVERAALTEQSKLLTAASAEVASALEAQETTMKEVRADLDAMLKRKKAEFALLQLAVETIRQSSGPGAEPPAPSEDRSNPDPMVQMPLSAVQRTGPRLEESARVEHFMDEIRAQGLTDLVRNASSGRQLRIALRPIVEGSVIEPQFEQVRNHWQERVPDLRGKAETARDRFAQLARLFPDEPRWGTMPAEIDVYLAALGKVTFGPPNDPEWWHSVVGKDDAVLEMKNVAVELIGTPSFRDATQALQRLIDERQQLVASLDAKLKDLQRQFAQQSDRLSDLISPIKGVALELSVVVGNFPLVLAFLLAAATIWPVRRYCTLIRAAALARRAELIDGPAAETLCRPSDWMRSVTLLFGQVAFFISWVGVAAWQLAPWQDRDGLNLAFMTAMAVLVLIGGALYKARVMRTVTLSTQST